MDKVVGLLNRILEYELAAVVRPTGEGCRPSLVQQVGRVRRFQGRLRSTA
jgi:hypothetical protein